MNGQPVIRYIGILTPRLREAIEREVNRGVAKWGAIDTYPGVLLNAALEELGEAAHAINHNEGPEKAQQEIVETIGILLRLYWMLEDV